MAFDGGRHNGMGASLSVPGQFSGIGMPKFGSGLDSNFSFTDSLANFGREFSNSFMDKDGGGKGLFGNAMDLVGGGMSLIQYQNEKALQDELMGIKNAQEGRAKYAANTNANKSNSLAFQMGGVNNYNPLPTA